MRDIFNKFCDRIHYHFQNEALLEEALTHPSLSKEISEKPNYQRLEFLGDKVLSLVISDCLMQKYPEEMEGDLSKRHAALVSGDNLADIALAIQLDDVIQLSKGELKLGGKSNKRNLENALEALIGAIYYDANYEAAKAFIMQFWADSLDKNIKPPKDPVSELQEIIQLKSKQLPQYHTVQSGGNDHNPTFTSSVMIPHLNQTFTAQGKSKKDAQKKVSKLALARISQ